MSERVKVVDHIERMVARFRLTTAMLVGVAIAGLAGFHNGDAQATGDGPDGRESEFGYVAPPDPARIELPREWRWVQPGVKVGHMYGRD